MRRKPTQTQKYLEAKAIHTLKGKIDLKKLWASEEDKELDPKVVGRLEAQ